MQRGYNLAQHGAFFAARTEFIQVLRRVAQAKDAGSNTDDHARALAAGLRALDEADDFVPQGVQLEAELDVRKVASSHRTPVLRDYPEEVLPQEAVVLYHSYAQQELSIAANGEQAGSMALYGLGKVYARLAERRDDDVQLTRSAMTMYSASLDACPDNHMAANELGVLLCRTGHAAEAVDRFTRAIDLAPTATAYHNLAVAQQKLGMAGQAAANEQESQRMAALDRSTGAVSRRAGVQWVSPAEMARVTQPGSPTSGRRRNLRPRPGRRPQGRPNGAKPQANHNAAANNYVPTFVGCRRDCVVRSCYCIRRRQSAQFCQPLTPAAPYPIWGVDSAAGRGCGEVGWDARGMIPWQEFAQGEYVGHARTPHVPEYRVREGDVIAVYYRRTREEISRPYELQVGDRIRVESLTAGHAHGGDAGRDGSRTGRRQYLARAGRSTGWHDHAAAAGPGAGNSPHDLRTARRA